MQALQRYGWPGNIRELRNVVERACVVARHDTIEPDDLPDRLRAAPSAAPPSSGQSEGLDEDQAVGLRGRLRQYETKLILAALRATGGNQTHAARRLDVPLRTFIHKMKNLGISKADYQQ